MLQVCLHVFQIVLRQMLAECSEDFFARGALDPRQMANHIVNSRSTSMFDLSEGSKVQEHQALDHVLKHWSTLFVSDTAWRRKSAWHVWQFRYEREKLKARKSLVGCKGPVVSNSGQSCFPDVGRTLLPAHTQLNLHLLDSA